jgi:hypothetical protein
VRLCNTDVNILNKYITPQMKANVYLVPLVPGSVYLANLVFMFTCGIVLVGQPDQKQLLCSCSQHSRSDIMAAPPLCPCRCMVT